MHITITFHLFLDIVSTLSRVQITFHGSSADIGWIQRDPTMDPVKDGSDRFVELLNEIGYFQHLHKSPIKLGMLKHCSIFVLKERRAQATQLIRVFTNSR